MKFIEQNIKPLAFILASVSVGYFLGNIAGILIISLITLLF